MLKAELARARSRFKSSAYPSLAAFKRVFKNILRPYAPIFEHAICVFLATDVNAGIVRPGLIGNSHRWAFGGNRFFKN